MIKYLICYLCIIIVLYSCTNREKTTSPTSTETKTKDVLKPSTPVETGAAVNYRLLISKDSIKQFLKTADTTA